MVLVRERVDVVACDHAKCGLEPLFHIVLELPGGGVSGPARRMRSRLDADAAGLVSADRYARDYDVGRAGAGEA